MVAGGITSSIRHQRTALDLQGVDYTTDPSDDYDVLHINLLAPRSLHLVWREKRRQAVGNGAPVVIHAHEIGDTFRDSFMFSNLLAPGVERYVAFAYNAADHVIAPSTFAKRRVREMGVDTPVDVVSNGIDADDLDGVDDAAVPSAYRTDEFTVVNLSSVFARKGVADFVDTGALLPDTTFRWFGHRFRVVTPLRTRYHVRRAPANVSFPGYIDDRLAAFRMADAFFFPSHAESQGISAIEAAYCGLPLVIRDIPVYDDLFTHGHDCLKGDSPSAFADHLSRLRDDPDLRAELGENAREMAQGHTLDHVGRELEAAYAAAEVEQG